MESSTFLEFLCEYNCTKCSLLNMDMTKYTKLVHYASIESKLSHLQHLTKIIFYKTVHLSRILNLFLEIDRIFKSVLNKKKKKKVSFFDAKSQEANEETNCAGPEFGLIELFNDIDQIIFANITQNAKLNESYSIAQSEREYNKLTAEIKGEIDTDEGEAADHKYLDWLKKCAIQVQNIYEIFDNEDDQADIRLFSLVGKWLELCINLVENFSISLKSIYVFAFLVELQFFVYEIFTKLDASFTSSGDLELALTQIDSSNERLLDSLEKMKNDMKLIDKGQLRYSENLLFRIFIITISKKVARLFNKKETVRRDWRECLNLWEAFQSSSSPKEPEIVLREMETYCSEETLTKIVKIMRKKSIAENNSFSREGMLLTIIFVSFIFYTSIL